MVNIHSHIAAENKIQSVSGSLEKQPAGSKSSFHLQDNRPKSVVQKKQVEAAADTRPVLLPKSTIQLFQIPQGHPDLRLSNGNRYLINNNHPDTLGVNADNEIAPTPHNFFRRGEVQNTIGGTWRLYRSAATFQDNPNGQPEQDGTGPNDCGFYAGALATNTPQWRNGAGMGALRDAHNNNPTGMANDYENNLTNEGAAANPGVGEAYFVFPPPGHQANGAFHHVATVVATDGGDRITNEANCTDNNRVTGHFSMYGTQVMDQTFLARYNDFFGTHHAPARVSHLVVPQPPQHIDIVHEDDDNLGAVPMDVGEDEENAAAVPMDLSGNVPHAAMNNFGR